MRTRSNPRRGTLIWLAALVTLTGLSTAGPAAGPAAATPAGDPAADRTYADAADQLEILIEEYNDLREQRRAAQVRIDALATQIDTFKRAIREQQTRIDAYAVNAYRTGGMPALATLLTPTDSLLRSLLLIDRLGQERQRGIERLAETRQRLDAARQIARGLAAEQAERDQQLSVRQLRIETDLDRLPSPRPGTGSPPRQYGGISALPPDTDSAGARAVRFAHAQLGKPYIWAGEGPHGYDCSGLTAAAWAAAGVRLPHNAARQWGAVTRVSRAERRPGDLVFYYRDIHHVGIYIGGGRIIHAPRPGDRIRIDEVDYQPVHGYGRPG